MPVDTQFLALSEKTLNGLFLYFEYLGGEKRTGFVYDCGQTGDPVGQRLRVRVPRVLITKKVRVDIESVKYFIEPVIRLQTMEKSLR